jgi:hypothetical protein
MQLCISRFYNGGCESFSRPDVPPIVKVMGDGKIEIIQTGVSPVLFVEMPASLFTGDGSGVKHRDRDIVIEGLVAGMEAHTHSAAADFIDDAVVE